MEEELINPVHLFTDYAEFYAAIERVKGDLAPMPLAWYSVKPTLKTFERFCEFVNTHQIENWIFDNGHQFCYIRFRLSAFRDAAIQNGLAKEDNIPHPR